MPAVPSVPPLPVCSTPASSEGPPLRPARGTPQHPFDSRREESPGLITEWCGHALIQRTLDPHDPDLALPENDCLNGPSPGPMDRFYTFPGTLLRQVTE